MALKDIIGQQQALNILKGFIVRERIPHALLFSGDDGIGKRLTAMNFAKTLNCSGTDNVGLFAADKTEGADIGQLDCCDACPACHKIAKGSHPDFFPISPEGDGGQITVSIIRKLEESMAFKAFEGKWKISIIDHADRLNQSAANAFLHTLEEPFDNSIFILVSSRPELILETIRSRCQRINFSPLPAETMSSFLMGELDGLDRNQSMLLSLLSGGRLGYAMSEDLLLQRDRSFEILEQMLMTNESGLWQDKAEMEEWFDWAQLWFRDIAVYKATGCSTFLINRDREKDIIHIAEKAVLRNVLKLARELYNIRNRLQFNLNKQLTFNYSSLLIRKRLGRSDVREQ
jgi:DNA polymerase-3 subunit delta'